jgi:cytoplasmic iron level regulating protein YaaA (DUF328/UPF0246 family)
MVVQQDNKEKEIELIKEELEHRRKVLTSHLQQLEDGTVERMIKKHIAKCQPATIDDFFYHHPFAFEETVTYYKGVVMEHIIQPIKDDVEEMETELIKKGEIEP